MNQLSDAQRARHAEFLRLFALLPGKSNTERARACAAATGLSLATLRQYRMAEPPRAPSPQVLLLLRSAVGVAA